MRRNNYRAKGKGPLELPRLSSIGPMSQTSDDIGNLLFRGSRLKDFNGDEFADNTIDGRPVDIWILDTMAVVQRYGLDTENVLGRHKSSYFDLAAENTDAEQSLIDEFRIGKEDINEFGVDTGIDWVPISDLEDNGLIARKIEEDVTGGLSTRLGAGASFAGLESGVDKAPLVMFLERNRIPARLTKVIYTEEFINEHPEIAGAADSGGRMIMAPSLTENFNLGNFTSRYKVGPRPGKIGVLRDEGQLASEIDDEELLVQWFDDPLENFFKLKNEEELFAHLPEINLDHALFGICSYLGKSRLRNIYGDVVGKSDDVTRFTREEDIDASLEEQVRVVYDAIYKEMEANQDRLVMCIVDNNLSVKDNRVKRANFELFYDGETFTRDYQQAIPFTDPNQF